MKIAGRYFNPSCLKIFQESLRALFHSPLQLFFEIEVNSGTIFTEPRSGEVNILPLFTEIEKNNCFTIYTGSDLNNIFRRKPLKIDSETLAKREFTPAILFLLGLRIIHSVGGE